MQNTDTLTLTRHYPLSTRALACPVLCVAQYLDLLKKVSTLTRLNSQSSRKIDLTNMNSAAANYGLLTLGDGGCTPAERPYDSKDDLPPDSAARSFLD